MVFYDSRKKVLSDALSSGEILDRYSWLLDSYVLDFFTEDLWGRIPSNWQEILENLEPQELGLWLDHDKIPKYRTPWPLSLLALRSSIYKFSLPRRKRFPTANNDSPEDNGKRADALESSKSVPKDFVTYSTEMDEMRKDLNHDPEYCAHFTSNVIGMTGEFTVNQQRGYIYAFQKHVKPKKRHEIFHLAKVVCKLAAKCGVKRVVDVGAGLGHLGRLLSYGHKLPTCCIESQRNLSSSARKLDEELEYTLSKYLKGKERESLVSPVHVTSSLTPEMDSSKFMKLVTKAFNEERRDDDGEDVGFGIVGLHPCGDLAVTLLRLFSDCSDAKFICIAGCCYMKLTPGFGFPISRCLDALSREKKDLQLSYEAREMACHALEAYSRSLLSDNHSHLKIHCYRATLEAIIAKNWPELRHSGLRSIKYSQGLQFSQYAKLALSPLDLVPPEEDLLSPLTTHCLERWRHVVIFYSLRLMFAPLVESFVLYDRLLYLLEKGFSCQISPEFDPEISPRNHLLMALKHSKESEEKIAS